MRTIPPTPPYTLQPISPEQQHARDLVGTSHVMVDAVAGSGKTTLALYIAKHYPRDLILLLTYNKHLKFETRQKREQLGLANLTVHSYHSCYNNFFSKCPDDSALIDILRANSKPWPRPHFSLIIIDEAQDITPLYFEAICNLLRWNTERNPRLCIIGDGLQCIYTYNYSDARYLGLADRLFSTILQDHKAWQHSRLAMTYRCPDGISEFVNQCMVGYQRLIPAKTGIKPEYIICNCFTREYHNNQNAILDKLVEVLRMGYKTSEIMILVPSVRGPKSISRSLENAISFHKQSIPELNHVSIYVPNDDEERVDEEVLQGKLVFLTFHKAKGLERKVVFVLSFDYNYFVYYKHDANPAICPNELYVAATRASERLFLFHHEKNEYLPFLKANLLSKYCTVQGRLRDASPEKRGKDTTRFAVVDLLRHLPSEVIKTACTYFTQKQLVPPGDLLEFPSKTIQNRGQNAEIPLIELVADINGTALPAAFELQLKGTLSILENIVEEHVTEVTQKALRFPEAQMQFLKNCPQHLQTLTLADILHISNLYNSALSGYNFKVDQITTYDWLTEDTLNLAIARLSQQIPPSCDFEEIVQTELAIPELGKIFTIFGSIDCITKQRIYEFKCVDELTDVHRLQLALYAYLYKQTAKKAKKVQFLLWNILTNEMIEIHSSRKQLEAMVQYLIVKKNEKISALSDAEFLAKQQEILQNYL